MGFSSQTRGDIDLLYKKLEQRNGIQAKHGLRTIQLEMGESPWFRYITVESTDGPEKPINFWLMEHHQDFLENVDIEVEKSGFLSRADYLAAELRNLYGEEASADRLFEDIVRIELELSAQERSALDALLSSFGYMRDDRNEVWIYTGPQCEIRARVTAAPAVRVQRLYCSLTTEIEDELLILATPDVSLWVGPGRVARWEFQCFE